MSQGPDQLCITRGSLELVEETGKVTKDLRGIISSNPHSAAACILLVEEIHLGKEQAMSWSQIKSP